MPERTMPRPRLLFISYSHEDRDWLQRILSAFKALDESPLLDVCWCDLHLKPTDEWRKIIQDKLAAATIGLFLVSRHFHNSGFIRDVELPLLRDAYHQGRVQLTWVRIDDVDYRLSVYNEFLAPIAPEPPLSSLSVADQEARLKELVARLIDVLKGRSGAVPAGHRVAHRWKLCSSLAAIAAIVLTVWALTHFGRSATASRTELLQMLNQRTWIGYDPSGFHPDRANALTVQSLYVDLKQVKSAGFTGIVTYGSSGRLAEIPAIAKRLGLGVIMGIWNPVDTQELMQAVNNASLVDAYCVGHDGLGQMYSEADLERAVKWLRGRTGKPVTTTQLSKAYSPHSRRLNLLGDFLFPDVHHNLTYTDLKQDVDMTVATINRLAKISAQYDRPLVAKVVTYPARGDSPSPVNLDKQAEFFHALLESIRDPITGTPSHPTFVVHSAFDAPWKRWGSFRAWDPYTGLLELSGEPRPAAKLWIKLQR